MGRADRRFRTENIAKKRFRMIHCDYNGIPSKYYLKKSLKDRQTLYGILRNGNTGLWRCRCDYCLGGILLKRKIENLNFSDGIEESIEDNKYFANFTIIKRLDKKFISH